MSEQNERMQKYDIQLQDRVLVYDSDWMLQPMLGTVMEAGPISTMCVTLDNPENLQGVRGVHEEMGHLSFFVDDEVVEVYRDQRKPAEPSFEVGQRVRVVQNNGPSMMDRYVGSTGKVTDVTPTKRWVTLDDINDAVRCDPDELEAVDTTRSSGNGSEPTPEAMKQYVAQALDERNALIEENESLKTDIAGLKQQREVQSETLRQYQSETRWLRECNDNQYNRIKELQQENNRLAGERDRAIGKANKLEAEKRERGQATVPNPDDVAAVGNLRVGDYIECTCGDNCPAKGYIKAFSEDGRTINIGEGVMGQVLFEDARKVPQQEDQPTQPKNPFKPGDMVKSTLGVKVGRVGKVVSTLSEHHCYVQFGDDPEPSSKSVRQMKHLSAS